MDLSFVCLAKSTAQQANQIKMFHHTNQICAANLLILLRTLRDTKIKMATRKTLQMDATFAGSL